MKKLIAALSLLLVGVVAYDVYHPPERFSRVAYKCLPSTVAISVLYTAKSPFTGDNIKVAVGGSGVFIAPDGFILTCAHLFNLPYKRNKYVTIDTYGGETVAAEVLVVSKKYDLALLRASAIKKNTFVQLADPRKLRIGQELIAIGSPYSLDFTVTHGIISGLYRDIGKSYNVTQADVFINSGNSGGPVFNLKGELVGINSFLISSIPFFANFTGLGFSVQSGQCLEFLTYNAKTISPHRRYKWLKLLNDAKIK